MATNTNTHKNTSTMQGSFLNDSDITNIIDYLLGTKLDDLKASYDTVSLKLIKQNA